MRRAGRVVDEERLVGRHRLLRLDPVDRLVGHVHGEVVVLHLRRLDLDQPVVDERIPLVGLAADEAVELVEALVRGPAIERSRHAGLPRGRLVPLAERAGAVAVEPQHLGEWRDAVRVLPGVAGKRRRRLHDRAGVDGVMVPPGLERVARRRAQRRRVEVVEAQSAAAPPDPSSACGWDRRRCSARRSRRRRSARSRRWARCWAPSPRSAPVAWRCAHRVRCSAAESAPRWAAPCGRSRPARCAGAAGCVGGGALQPATASRVEGGAESAAIVLSFHGLLINVNGKP